MKEIFNQAFSKFLNDIMGMKFLALVGTFVLICVGKISEGIWQETVMVILGLRVATDLTAIVKGAQTQPPPDTNVKVPASDKQS